MNLSILKTEKQVTIDQTMEEKFAGKTKAEVFREYWNDWVTSCRMAEHYQLKQIHLELILEQGRVEHEQMARSLATILK